MSLEIAFDSLAKAVKILGKTSRTNFSMIKVLDEFTARLSKMIDHLVKASDIQDERLRVLEEHLLRKTSIKEGLPN